MENKNPFSGLIEAFKFVLFMILITVPSAFLSNHLATFSERVWGATEEESNTIALISTFIFIGLLLLLVKYFKIKKEKNGFYPTIGEVVSDIRKIPSILTSISKAIFSFVFKVVKWFLKPALWLLFIFGSIWLIIALGPLWIIAIVLVLILLALSNR